MAEGIEMLDIDLGKIQTSTKCPICLDVIRGAKVVMVCLHRLCGTCIEQSLRMNKLECPLCRARMSSRRDTRPDPNFDALVSAIYGDVEGFNEDELKKTEDINTQYAMEHVRVLRDAEKQDRANKNKSIPAIPQGVGPTARAPRPQKPKPTERYEVEDEPEPSASHGGAAMTVEELKARASALREESREALRRERDTLLLEVRSREFEGTAFFVRLPGEATLATLAESLARPLALSVAPRLLSKQGGGAGPELPPEGSVRTALEAQGGDALLYWEPAEEMA